MKTIRAREQSAQMAARVEMVKDRPATANWADEVGTADGHTERPTFTTL